MQRRLRIHDLDRAGELEEDQGQRLDHQQQSQRRNVVDVAPRRPQPRPHRDVPRLRDVRVQVEQHQAADEERSRVDEQGGRPAGRGHDHAGDHGPQRERARERHVDCRVGLALRRMDLLLGRHAVMGVGDVVAGRPRRLSPQQRARRERGGPVERHDHEHRRQPEVPEQDRERGRGEPLEHIQAAERPAAGKRLDAGYERGGDERRQHLARQQQRSHRDRAVQVVEDGDREGDEAEPGAEAVDGIGGDDPAQPR